LNPKFELTSSINLVIPSCDIPIKSLNHSKGNITYISDVNGKNKTIWNKLKKRYSWIESLKLDLKEYNSTIFKLKKCLDNEAYLWFKKQYYNYPLKVHQEMIHLIFKSKTLNRKLNLDDLRYIYGIANSYKFYEYVRALGNFKLSNQILLSFNTNTYWSGFIGVNEPLIYKGIKEKYPSDYHHLWMIIDTFIQLIKMSRMNINPGVFILNYMLNKIIENKFRNASELTQYYLAILKYM